MKKAFLDQLFLGFLLLMGIATFVATVSDEAKTRNKIYDLKQIALKTSQAMARSYEKNLDMCYGKTIAEDILAQSSLGKELLKLKKDGNITFDYDYYDLKPTNADGSVGDNEPDTVIARITGYKDSTFWYKFFDKDDFDIGQITESEDVGTPRDVTIRYGARPNASYQNIMGTYELDNNNCVTNMKMYMANSKEWDKWEQLVDPSDPNSPRIPIADGITSPPTYVFSVANGNNQFNSPSDNANVKLEEDHCFGSSVYPKITINGTTKQATVGNTNSANVFFEHDELNADGYNHFHIIPKSILPDYVNYKNNIYTANGNEKDKYEAFLTYCDNVNNDANHTNDIGGGAPEDCNEDPNDEYHYALEDLDAGGSDFDFTDMILDSTRVVKKNVADEYTVDNDQKIVFDSGYCEEDTNIPPTLVLQGCPVQMNEDEVSNVVNWTATDSDGTIQSKDVSTNHGSAVINPDGTLTYTPDQDYYGEDTITMIIKDDDDALAKEECLVKITEVNDDPTISGTPITTIKVNEFYNFLVSAEDIDGDNVTFSANLPAWLTIVPLPTDSYKAQVSGTPTNADVGTYQNIVISVSDGRGGSAQLSPFDIVVTNDAPTTSGIPDDSTKENNPYSYDISGYFNDGNGDTLKYSLSGNLPDTMVINENTGVITADIEDNLAPNTYNITVTASDGISSVSDDFILTIISNTSCNGPYENKFNGDTNGWTGGYLSTNGKRYIVPAGTLVYKSYFFGTGCRNIELDLNFSHRTGNAYDGKIEVYTQESNLPVDTYNGTGKNWIAKSIKVKTNNDGWLGLGFRSNSSKEARIDNIKIEFKSN